MPAGSTVGRDPTRQGRRSRVPAPAPSASRCPCPPGVEASTHAPRRRRATVHFKPRARRAPCRARAAAIP